LVSSKLFQLILKFSKALNKSRASKNSTKKMKKLFLSLSMLLVALLPARAFEFPGFEWEVGAEVTSKYLWRGMNLGGLAFQPTASVGYGGAKLEVWANLSPNDYTFKEFTPELDLTLSYQLKGIWVSINHQHYFNGYKYFDYKGETTNQLEVGAGIDFQDLFDKIGLRFSWQTYVAGDDHYETDKLDANGNKIALLDENGSIVLDENGNTMYETEMKRAYSTYFEVAYTTLHCVPISTLSLLTILPSMCMHK